jgi:hypothetical protein
MQAQRRIYLLIVIGVMILSNCGLIRASNSDQAVLDSLRDAGSDLTKVHPFDFYLYHDEETGARQICDALTAQGFQVEVREGAVQGEWLCLASLSFVPSIQKLSDLKSTFEDLILIYGGEYDGWETFVVP